MLSSRGDETSALLIDDEGPPDTRNRPPNNRAIVEHVLVADYSIFQRIALKRLGNRTDADDVLHAFCVKALERAHQLRSADAVHGWLRRLFETTLLDHFRQAARLRRRIVSSEQSPPAEDDIIGGTLADDETEVIEGVLPRLRPSYAQIIRRMDLSREEPSTVANALGISQNNLAVRLHRARRAFRAVLADTPVVLQE
ncbi:hypothetical protein CP97_05685 [Aurantiacibacter atlanticus]|uniref:RNA polymerase sigma-70 region 2 domain-containing protein n=1 Tax=Aurantiacibacter atlanticus TaxID=1648404 RepID=A0A0H4VK11_9SPHN|nr:sigma-70 family RNA polymerase sigma factor [Aurantiacibacter atlanticus]AKQ43206.2 hypothetical protein CP97_05685 [Aurantiacibacter atlanticus]